MSTVIAVFPSQILDIDSNEDDGVYGSYDVSKKKRGIVSCSDGTVFSICNKKGYWHFELIHKGALFFRLRENATEVSDAIAFRNGISKVNVSFSKGR